MSASRSKQIFLDALNQKKIYIIGHGKNLRSLCFKDNLIEGLLLLSDQLNIEGEEYKLLSDIVDNNLQTKIGNIQVQFHDFIEDIGRGRPYIHEKLWITHHLTYNFPFVWENWEINK